MAASYAGEVAWAAIHERGSSFRARNYRLKPRLGVLLAIMHQLLKVIYHILKTGGTYRELGADYYQPADPQPAHQAHRTARLYRYALPRLSSLTEPWDYFSE